jgi:hypothetical protein
METRNPSSAHQHPSAEKATLTVIGNASGDPQTVQLSGPGVAKAVMIVPTATTVETRQAFCLFRE